MRTLRPNRGASRLLTFEAIRFEDLAITMTVTSHREPPKALTKRMQKCLDSRLRRVIYCKEIRAKHLQQTKQLRGYLAPARKQREVRRFPPANQRGEDARKRNAATFRLCPLSGTSPGQKRWCFRPAARTDSGSVRHYSKGEPVTRPRPRPRRPGQPCPRRLVHLRR